MDKAGAIKVRGTTTDGSGVDDEIQINVKVHLTAFDVTVSKTQIGLLDRLVLTRCSRPRKVPENCDAKFGKWLYAR